MAKGFCNWAPVFMLWAVVFRETEVALWIAAAIALVALAEVGRSTIASAAERQRAESQYK